jgi:hypothetical protein
MGPIPWTAVQQYAEAERMTRDETDMLHEVVRHMDSVFRAHVSSRRAQAAK